MQTPPSPLAVPAPHAPAPHILLSSLRSPSPLRRAAQTLELHAHPRGEAQHPPSPPSDIPRFSSNLSSPSFPPGFAVVRFHFARFSSGEIFSGCFFLVVSFRSAWHRRIRGVWVLASR